jgi:hypothetical protein
MKNLLLLSMIGILLSACSHQPTTSKTPVKDEDLASALSSLFGAPLKPDMQEVEKHPLGSIKNPIRVSMPVGQRDYLSRLICENNEPVSAFSRGGSVGIGPYGSMLDVYTVVCDTDQGAVEHAVYMDMYHGNYIELRPAVGFKALKAKK